jgi:hypothetical protein
VNDPFGASGSSTRIAMVLVVLGTVDHDSGGVVEPPSQVYSGGIASLAVNALEVTWSSCFVEVFGAGGVLVIGGAASTLAGTAANNTRGNR